jgi:hypothetical protein
MPKRIINADVSTNPATQLRRKPAGPSLSRKAPKLDDLLVGEVATTRRFHQFTNQRYPEALMLYSVSNRGRRLPKTVSKVTRFD